MRQDERTAQTQNVNGAHLTEAEIADALFVGLFSGSEPIDRFTSWLLAGIAGTASLLVSGIATVMPHLSVSGYRACMAALAISGVFGLLSKHRALLVKIRLEQDRATMDALNAIEAPSDPGSEESPPNPASHPEQEATAVSVMSAYDIVISAFPKLMHPYLRRDLSEGLKDRHYGDKSAVRHYLYQIAFSAAQAVGFLVFVVVAVCYASAI